jgi:lipopolysaccharide transport system ATP-binding protein
LPININMQKNLAIKVTNLGKRYKIGGRESYLTIRDALLNLIFNNRLNKSFWALRDVGFQVKKGEVFGIIGANGAGKSTLLKLLSRITSPTEGEILIRGKLSSLLELGAGFNSELTGRENIYLNGIIAKFSGIAKFLDTPAKYYSSGMFIRLGLAIALQVKFDILVIDEVLSVVDKQFQEQVFEFLGKLSGKGKTIIIVSHNFALIKKYCQRVLVLEKGKIKKYGLDD